MKTIKESILSSSGAGFVNIVKNWMSTHNNERMYGTDYYLNSKNEIVLKEYPDETLQFGDENDANINKLGIHYADNPDIQFDIHAAFNDISCEFLPKEIGGLLIQEAGKIGNLNTHVVNYGVHLSARLRKKDLVISNSKILIDYSTARPQLILSCLNTKDFPNILKYFPDTKFINIEDERQSKQIHELINISIDNDKENLIRSGKLAAKYPISEKTYDMLCNIFSKKFVDDASIILFGNHKQYCNGFIKGYAIETVKQLSSEEQQKLYFFNRTKAHSNGILDLNLKQL
jgi:hypothetical protein